MKRLIINADDYNLTPGCDRAIQTAMYAGAVSSASCLVWSLTIGEFPTQATDAPLISPIGVHLRLTGGRLLSGSPTLRKPLSCIGDVRTAGIDPADVWVEWAMQIAAVVDSSKRITHLDSHHHVHGLAFLWDVYAGLCRLWEVPGVPLSPEQRTHMERRGVRCVDFTEMRWTDGRQKTLQLMLIADFNRYDTVHLMTHPGEDDADLRAVSSMTAVRAQEFDVLMSAEFRGWLRDHEIEVIGYDKL